MKCLVAGSNVKVLGKAVHSLSRIGDELYLEPLEDGLSLRTVNSSRSAYACFLFARLFFQQYQAATPGQHPLRCKILMKSFLSVFRSLAMLEKTVERCCISLNGRSSRLVVQLHCKYGVRKTHNLSFQDCESLQAVFDPGLCPNVLRAPARVLGEAVLPFPPALAEVTLGIGRGRRVILRSYQEEEAGEGARCGLGRGARDGLGGGGAQVPPVAAPTDSTTKAMVTEMSIGEEDFQQLQAQEGVAVTFCLKEFRGLLSFAESANLPLSVYFDAPGRPAIFAIEDSLLDGHFVLATLSESALHPQDPHALELQRLQPAPPLQAHSTPHLDDDFAVDDIDSYMIAMETTVSSEGSRVLPSTSLSLGLQPPSSPGPYSEEEDDAEPSTVPGTPPPKKFRSLFFGSILAPAHSPQGPSPVLAEDSEGEG
ncbi:cell cycle checkpoint control protein RAD9A isoform X1 [Hippopotamus amphibius kiboko]|uniref:cell cycle checkpoint control protein RAD9A isoform X1 n=1 Tax=Hippopotamus amphibius kiboko TaxID=575201 RepID=UPI0025945962|nr:cell cycle checkpoint control protein RAD9A isoform X1 [Hippopotamus amphibius kiboko]XP_057585489.1 cell cycle checkpoint control protein RAD9A isoform X1 [Hippopotamus amphibius kiboko]XP_057585490.1 cell cycle checkpoint control protein RAD9A isoform X1 [Hippopotamus amphibius kiboko]XP_057585491.1 cell cycle checkpoint control protein RAD9A isoform X1 [Hippopotamus amphibius kiboko]XP_057585492.1 cell cycle checkpoint control protein RAD9A isoform X1 [Hippopotamus amphibius kiboko]XP_05